MLQLCKKCFNPIDIENMLQAEHFLNFIQIIDFDTADNESSKVFDKGFPRYYDDDIAVP